jgi:folate-binding protein YgfZ
MTKISEQIDLQSYEQIRSDGLGFRETDRGLIAVWGKEAVQFLNGMITNDVAQLDDGAEMLAAFPNAQGRLLAIVRFRRGGERFLFETEQTTHEKVFNNLFRFTFAGEFFVEDLSEQYRFFELFGRTADYPPVPGEVSFSGRMGTGRFVPSDAVSGFRDQLSSLSAVGVTEELYEVLRIEQGVPLYGKDMDETTIIPELGLDGMISYEKGCYVGQEIIARIHFRGHVAKQLMGLVLSEPLATEGGLASGDSTLILNSADGKNAGRITSTVYSPKLERTISLGYVRYDYLAPGTELKISDASAIVTPLPFVG